MYRARTYKDAGVSCEKKKILADLVGCAQIPKLLLRLSLCGTSREHTTGALFNRSQKNRY